MEVHGAVEIADMLMYCGQMGRRTGAVLMCGRGSPPVCSPGAKCCGGFSAHRGGFDVRASFAPGVFAGG